eukprot:Platyproteum_vivax@DN4228_c0_g1_i1.p1
MWLCAFCFFIFWASTCAQDALILLNTTERGCVCLREWEFRGERYTHCASPEGKESWCVVSEKCNSPHAIRATPEGNGDVPIDFCDSSGTIAKRETTDGGCMCSKFWMYQNEIQIGCTNPDEDPQGSWCATDRKCLGTDVYGSDDDGITPVYWDYCGEPPSEATRMKKRHRSDKKVHYVPKLFTS